MRADKLIGKWFLPVSWIYGLAVWIRNMLYSDHLLPSYEVSVPTICVGNLAVGGTGKTPHVEYLIRLLTSHGFQVAVLSRGYGRKTKGYLEADMNSTARSIGDEPMLLHTKFPDVPVVVCKHRVAAIKRMQRDMKDLQVVILDDAFQYRKLRCGYNILLTKYDNLYVNDLMLPAGRLRDNKHQALRANAIVVTKCPETMPPIERRIVDTKLHVPSYQGLYFSRMEYDDIDLDFTPLIVAGIAHPETLLEHIQERFPKAKLMAFPDHHTFTDKDIEAIAAESRHFKYVLTTEKDYVRLTSLKLPDYLRAKLRVQSIEVKLFEDQENFDREVLRYVREGQRKETKG